MSSKKPLFRISFLSDEKIYEIYAREVAASDMFGFVEVGDFVFGETSSLVVDPNEEKLKHEFADVKRCYIPMQEILRIDEVEKQGIAKITPASSKATVTPLRSSLDRSKPDS